MLEVRCGISYSRNNSLESTVIFNMKYLTYVFIAGLMLLVVACDWIEDTTGRNFDGVFEKATPTPTPLPTATPFPAIDVKALISQYQYDPVDGKKSDFKKRYQGKNLQIYVKGLYLYHGSDFNFFITYDEIIEEVAEELVREDNKETD